VLKFASEEDVKNAKKTPLVVKEGTEFKIRIMFRVQHNVVLGLKILNQVSKMGKTIAKDEEMLGTYPPKNEFQSLEIPRLEWNEAPSGILLRGEYKSKMRFVDDDNRCHLELDYVLKIAKDWAGATD
jgi:Rho GDP-dissociation inhibitor